MKVESAVVVGFGVDEDDVDDVAVDTDDVAVDTDDVAVAGSGVGDVDGAVDVDVGGCEEGGVVRIDSELLSLVGCLESCVEEVEESNEEGEEGLEEEGLDEEGEEGLNEEGMDEVGLELLPAGGWVEYLNTRLLPRAAMQFIHACAKGCPK